MKAYVRLYLKIILLSLFLNMLIEAVSRKSLSAMIRYIGEAPLVFLLNTLIIMLPFTLAFVVRRRVFTVTVVAVMWAGMGLMNGFLLTFRTTPFTAEDFRLAKYGLNMITNYMSWFQIILSVTGIALTAACCLYLWRKAPVEQGKAHYKTGVTIVAASCALVVGLTSFSMRTGLVAVHFGNIGQAFLDYGFPYCFSNSLVNTGISKPEDYGSELLDQIEEESLKPEYVFGIGDNKTPNIIMIQLESFFDPTLWKHNPVTYDPIPFFRYLSNHYPSGYLNVPSVGAGTANTEFEVITGMNLDFFGPGEYPYKTVLKKTSCESTAFDLKMLGYSAHAIHNNEATFYDRNHVFSQLGFDTFTPIEYMYHVERNPIGWCKDKILTGEIMKALTSTKENDFIYTISVQGHGKYPDFEYYCEQISEMDDFVRELINTLNMFPEPTVVVLYGDHLPGFAWEEGDMRNNSLYQTKYVVWNNLQLPEEKKTVEAYQLSAYVLNMVGIHEGTMMRFHQNYLDEKHPDSQAYLADMQALEYDILYGDHEIYEGESPFQSTDLQMGIDPIQIDQVIYNDSNVLVYGKNFNPYSKICLGGKPQETIYVWPELLIAKDLSEKKVRETTLTVEQIGRDKRPLGKAEDLREKKWRGYIASGSEQRE